MSVSNLSKFERKRFKEDETVGKQVLMKFGSTEEVYSPEKLTD